MFRRRVALLLSVTVLIALLPAVVAASPADATGTAAASSVPHGEIFDPGTVNRTPVGTPDPPPPPAVQPDVDSDLVEVPELAGEGSQTFRRPDGSMVTRFDAAPDAAPEPEAESLQPDGDALVAAWQPDELRLPSALADGPVQLRDKQGRQLDVAMLDVETSTVADVDGGQASYADAVPGVEVRLTAETDRVKEELVLADAGAERSFSWDVAGPGTDAVVQDDGSVIVSEGGGVAFVIAAPFMVDATDVRSTAITVDLQETGAGWRLSYTLDDAWLDAAERVWPVTVDPTVSWDLTGTNDCEISKGIGSYAGQFENDWLCHYGRITVGRQLDGGGQPYRINRGLLRFPVEQTINVPAQIRSATLSVSSAGGATGASSVPMEAHMATQGWVDASTTWRSRQSGVLWSTAGALAAGSVPVDVNPTFGDQTGARQETFYLASAVQRWVDGDAANNGIVLKTANETLSRSASFEGANTGAPANYTPLLEVEWTPLVGIEETSSLQSFETGSGQQEHVNVVSGNFMITEDEATIAGTNGHDLQLTRTYNAQQQDSYAGIGKFWTHYASSGGELRIDDANRAVALQDWRTGFNVAFTKLPSASTWRATRAIDAELTHSTGGDWRLRWRRTGETIVWHNWGQMKRIEDRNGNTITFNYDTNYRIASITDTQGAGDYDHPSDERGG